MVPGRTSRLMSPRLELPSLAYCREAIHGYCWQCTHYTHDGGRSRMSIAGMLLINQGLQATGATYPQDDTAMVAARLQYYAATHYSAH
jgi:hypothetical protein